MTFVNVMKDRFNPGTDLTAITSDAVVGKTFAAISEPMKGSNVVCATAVAGAMALGVVKYDAAAGETVGIARGASRVVTVTAGGSIEAGSQISVGEAGQAVVASDGALVVGYAVDSAAPGEDALVSLNF